MLNLFWQKRPAPSLTGPVDRVELRHLDGAVAERVRAFFAGELPNFTKEATRSVRFSHPSKEGVEIKIKGAGFEGGDIQFGILRKTGPKAVVFDFDGRVMEDVASGHDNAFAGGASFQQAATEYRMTQRLASLGYRVVPCLGIGKVEKAGLASWFSVFEMRSDWSRIRPPACSLEEYCDAKVSMGALIRDLAVEHDLIGYAWYVATPDGERYIKDLHPFRQADPISMSQLSWMMQVFFALHIVALAAIHFSKSLETRQVPRDIRALCFRAIQPSARDADHQALRWALVVPYILRPREKFDQRELVAVLRGNPITSAMLDLCPEKYERY
jgi:hypothetical protein